jgi:hypothetical protein
VQSSDQQPTDQAREAYAFLDGQLRLVRTEYDVLARMELAAFNATLRRRGFTTILTTVP